MLGDLACGLGGRGCVRSQHRRDRLDRSTERDLPAAPARASGGVCTAGTTPRSPLGRIPLRQPSILPAPARDTTRPRAALRILSRPRRHRTPAPRARLTLGQHATIGVSHRRRWLDGRVHDRLATRALAQHPRNAHDRRPPQNGHGRPRQRAVSHHRREHAVHDLLESSSAGRSTDGAVGASICSNGVPAPRTCRSPLNGPPSRA